MIMIGRSMALGLVLLVGCAGVGAGDIGDTSATDSATLAVARSAIVRSAPSRESVADTAPAWCEGRATSRLLLKGNLYPQSSIMTWSPSDPDGTSNTSVSLTPYTAEGYPIGVSIYFSNQGSFFTYHVLAGSERVEIGGGALYFDASGALLHVKELQPLRLVGPDGLEPPLTHLFGTPRGEGGTGLDGLTSLPGWDQISAIEHDGAPRVVGHACPDGAADEEVDESDTPPAPSRLSACPGRATTRVAIQANLAGGAPIPSIPWNPLEPAATSSFVTSFVALDADHALAGFDVYFRRLARSRWEYRVLLQSEQRWPEVARGSLRFHRDGTLASVEVRQPFRFPTPNGVPGAELALDFGTPTGDGGTGADGVTAFLMSSFLIAVEQDGVLPSVDSSCPTDPAPMRYLDFPAPLDSSRYQASFQPTPACAGTMTRSGSLSLVLDSNLPIANESWNPAAPLGPSEQASTAIVYDSALHAIPIGVRARRISRSSWEVHLSTYERAEPVERAVARLDLDESGQLLAHVEGNLRFSLPLEDGREGTAMELELPTPLDQGGASVLSIPGYSFIGISVNGSAASDCTLL